MSGKAMVSFNLVGGKELTKVLQDLPFALRKKTLYGILKNAAEPVRARMASLAPRGPTHKTTVPRPGEANIGHLADAIVVSVTDRVGSVEGGRWEVNDEYQAAVAVGPDRAHYYGIMLEYGTARIPTARPFMRPAFDAVAPTQSLTIIREEMWEVIRQFVSQYVPVAVQGGPGGGGLL